MTEYRATTWQACWCTIKWQHFMPQYQLHINNVLVYTRNTKYNFYPYSKCVHTEREGFYIDLCHFQGLKPEKKHLVYQISSPATVDHCHLDNRDRAEDILSCPRAHQGFQHILRSCQISSLHRYILANTEKGERYGPKGQYRSSFWTPKDPVETMPDWERNRPLSKLSDTSCHSQSMTNKMWTSSLAMLCPYISLYHFCGYQSSHRGF